MITSSAGAASLRDYAGTSPNTRASGKGHVVLAGFIRNKRLNDAIYLWSFAALTRSPGAGASYEQRRAAGDKHAAALRRLGSKLLGQLHHCVDAGPDGASAWVTTTPGLEAVTADGTRIQPPWVA